jgi:hypothetical protein
MFWLVLQGVRNLAISKKVEELTSLITFVSVYPFHHPPSAVRLILLKSCHAVTELTDIQLLAGNALHWNIVYHAINRAIEVRERINRFVRDHVPHDHRSDDACNPKDDRLTNIDLD